MARVKGFFMSIDSILTIIIVFAGLAILLFGNQFLEPDSKTFSQISQKMQDYSVIGFYQQKDEIAMGVQGTLLFTGKTGRCVEQSLSEVETSPFNSDPDFALTSFCEERG